jgi:hypothetical protein
VTSHPHVAKEDGLQQWWACMAPATAALGEARKFPSKPVHWERMGGPSALSASGSCANLLVRLLSFSSAFEEGPQRRGRVQFARALVETPEASQPISGFLLGTGVWLRRSSCLSGPVIVPALRILLAFVPRSVPRFDAGTQKFTKYYQSIRCPYDLTFHSSAHGPSPQHASHRFRFRRVFPSSAIPS